jgi:hypothetical protein
MSEFVLLYRDTVEARQQRMQKWATAGQILTSRSQSL